MIIGLLQESNGSCTDPVIFTGYGIVVYDKAILGSAALLGMKTDLMLAVGTDTSRLSLATSLFYIGQLAGSYPSSYLVQHFRTRWVVGPAVMLWAIVAASTAGCTTYKGLYAQRFFLGKTSPALRDRIANIIKACASPSSQHLS